MVVRVYFVLTLLLLAGCSGDSMTPGTASSPVSERNVPSDQPGNMTSEPVEAHKKQPDQEVSNLSQEPETPFQDSPEKITTPISGELTAQEKNAEINVRSAPSAESTAVGFGLVGTPVVLLNSTMGDDGYSWYEIEFKLSSARGWVRGDLVKKREDVPVGQIAGLDSQQLDQLKAIAGKRYQLYDTTETFQADVVIPTYVPPGFTISKFDVLEEHNYVEYTLAYKNSANVCFGFYGWAGRPAGDAPEDYDFVEVNSPALGQVGIAYTTFSETGPGHWVGFREYSPTINFTKYRFDSPFQLKAGKDLEGCLNVSVPEAVAIVESLQFVRP